MASRPTDTPSSLQEQCLQYLIDHLEDIPVEFLALLPTAIRRTLAVHLPVADILQLEQTRFASGLDMPGVWKEVCEILRLFSRYPKLKEMFDSEIEAKEFVIMVVVYEAIRYKEKPHDFLAKPFLGHHLRLENKPSRIPGPPIFFSRVFIEPRFKPPHCAVPSRFVTMHRNIDGEVLKVLNTRYHITPERLYIDCSNCVDVRNIVALLPRLKQLSLSCMMKWRNQSSYHLHSLLSGCSQCLHTLTLDDCPDERIEKIVSTVASVFTNCPANFQSLRHFVVTVYHAPRQRCYYRCGTGRMRAMTRINCNLQKALITLCKVIQTHTSLHSCSFRQWPVTNDHEVLGSILSLFEKPQFQCLTLRQTSLSFENIQHLVHTFLTTPCNGPQTLKLEYIQCHIFSTDHTGPSIPNSSTDFLLHKSLVLHLIFSPIDRVLKWLSTICKLHLHSLTVTMD